MAITKSSVHDKKDAIQNLEKRLMVGLNTHCNSIHELNGLIPLE
jgi:hypothetical protein